MTNEKPENFEKEAIKEDPAQTIAPPQIKLQQEPIPNPDIKQESTDK